MINIAGLDKAAVLAALHNATRAVGMGIIHDLRRPMTLMEAEVFIKEGTNDTGDDRATYAQGNILYFDYVCGRPLKVNLSGDEFDERNFDRGAGAGAAARAIDAIR
jgi:hypothetical protein